MRYKREAYSPWMSDGTYSLYGNKPAVPGPVGGFSYSTATFPDYYPHDVSINSAEYVIVPQQPVNCTERSGPCGPGFWLVLDECGGAECRRVPCPCYQLQFKVGGYLQCLDIRDKPCGPGNTDVIQFNEGGVAACYQTSDPQPYVYPAPKYHTPASTGLIYKKRAIFTNLPGSTFKHPSKRAVTYDPCPARTYKTSSGACAPIGRQRRQCGTCEAQ